MHCGKFRRNSLELSKKLKSPLTFTLFQGKIVAVKRFRGTTLHLTDDMKVDVKQVGLHCSFVLRFWKGFQDFWYECFQTKITLTVKEIIVGCYKDRNEFLNYCI